MKKLVRVGIIFWMVVFAFSSGEKTVFAQGQEDERTQVLVHSVPGEPELERMVLIFRKERAKEKVVGIATDQDTSYKLILGGLRWEKLPVSYGINDSGAPLGSFSEVEKAFEQWDKWTSKELFGYPGSITGTGGGLQRDKSNTVSWQSLALFGSDVVAVCQLVYNVRTKTMLEFDIAFNSVQPWATNGSSDAFDVRNVATHEAGHPVSLDDLYRLKTSELTMYGYTTEGETKKQDLGEGDKLGLWKVYGQ